MILPLESGDMLLDLLFLASEEKRAERLEYEFKAAVLYEDGWNLPAVIACHKADMAREACESALSGAAELVPRAIIRGYHQLLNP